MNSEHAFFLPRLRLALIAMLIGSIVCSHVSQAVEPSPLPAGVRSRLTTLLETTKAPKAVCVNTEELANLLLTVPDYTTEILTLVAHAIAPKVPPAPGSSRPIRSEPDLSMPQANDESQCNCLAEAAGAGIAVIPNRSAQVYQALAEITPQCSVVVGNRMREVLLNGQPAFTTAASSGNAPPSSAQTGPFNFCAYGGLCSAPLQSGDNHAESPTRLRGKG